MWNMNKFVFIESAINFLGDEADKVSSNRVVYIRIRFFPFLRTRFPLSRLYLIFYYYISYIRRSIILLYIDSVVDSLAASWRHNIGMASIIDQFKITYWSRESSSEQMIDAFTRV